VVHPKGRYSKDPSPLKVKEVWVEERRYIVCLNEDQRSKEALEREAIVRALREQLKRGDKSLVGNKGYRRYLKSQGARFAIDEQKIIEEARYDGKWVLRTNTDLSAAEVALKYKQLWMVEEIFRSAKSLLETRPIFHKCDDTIRGHVFCSFLALVLRKELQARLEAAGSELEWAEVMADLEALEDVPRSFTNKNTSACALRPKGLAAKCSRRWASLCRPPYARSRRWHPRSPPIPDPHYL
jgi:hypothetical protein